MFSFRNGPTYEHKTSADGAPDPDGLIKEVVRIKIRNYRNVYLNHPDPIAFIPLVVDTTGHLYDEFIRLLFLVSFNTLTMSHHGIGLGK